MQADKANIDKIDILRGIAIVAVFCFHAQYCLFPNYYIGYYNSDHLLAIRDNKDLWLNFFPTAYGWCGVELFLLISGFLIHLGYLRAGQVFKPRVFFAKRFWRIYPPYLLVLLFMCLSKDSAYYWSTWKGAKDFVLHLFLLNNLSDDAFFGINPSFWTLALEAQLYLIYPLFLYIRRRLGVEKAFLLVLSISLTMLFVGSLTNGFNTVHIYNDFVFNRWYIWCAGALLAECYSRQESLFRGKALLVSLVAFLLFYLVRINYFTNMATVYLATLGWLAFFEFFLAAHWIKASTGIYRVFTAIGVSSYSIYLIHQPYIYDLFSYFHIRYDYHHSALNILVILVKSVMVFALVYLFSYALYLLVELKSVSYGKSKMR